MRRAWPLAWAAFMAAATLAGASFAHHSFAVFFDGDKTVQVTGVVKQFVFSNPHGLIDLVVDKDGKPEAWRVETNAPVLLRQRGWTPDSLKVGDKVVITGWAARDGSNYVRLKSATHPDGTPIGQSFAPSGQQ
jgi:hypothetical protein